MRRLLHLATLVTLLGCLWPNTAESCHRCNHAAKWCGFCRKAQTSCVCVPPPPLQTCLQPVVETHTRMEQVCTPKTIVETHYRNECYTKTVPTVCYKTITVDEGCWQQIWVPKMVQKQIPETVYTQQVATRPVPYQVTKVVNEMSTRAVPYCTTRYLPVTVDPCPPGGTPAAVSAYPLPPSNYASAPPAAAPPALPGTNPATLQAPIPAGPVASPTAVGPVPDPRYGETPSQGPQFQNPTSSRTAPRVAPLDAQVVDNRPTHPPAASSPSAATVWRSPRGTAHR